MLVRTKSPGCVFSLVAACLFLLGIQGCRHKHTTAPGTDHATTTSLEQALHADADAEQLASLRWPNFSDYKPLVETFYKQRDWDPAWVDKRKPTQQARALIGLFAASASKGLNADDYDAALWADRLHALPHDNDQQVAAFDTAMTVCTMRYVSDLHVGRVNPIHFNFGVDIQKKKYDLPGFLVQQVVTAKDMNAALKGIEPDSDTYRNTLSALNHYQALAQQAPDEEPLPVPLKPITPGSPYSGATALAARLTLVGDLVAPNEASPPKRYTAALAEGVKSFQSRHNLYSSGLLTPQTVADLNIPLATRVQQLEDTLERLRWLAPEYQSPPVFVNLPEYTLRVYNDDHSIAFQMPVVVGQAKVDDHKTPMLSQEMRYVVLRPFWNVTPTIVKEELVPHVQADHDYLESKNFEVVDRRGKPVHNWTVDGLAKNLYMVREKPGPGNSLGLIKFMFPNKLNIYLHSTPAVQLFTRSRRDFSHGCVRIQNPEQLADWVLRDQPKWDPDTIHDAMENGDDNKTVVLTHPIPVLIFYATARVAEDGKVHFFNDLYGYDADMESVLAKGPPYPVKPEVKKQTGDTA